MRASRRIGSVVAHRYRLDGVLGRGGMSVVYRATHTLTQRPVALKLLEVTEASDHDTFARFLQEGQAAAKLQHPNVVEVLDMGNLDDGSLYLALELLEGKPLSDRLAEKRRLGPKEALELLLPIMDAVAAAHRLGLVHRDLKPANIFLHRVGDRTIPKLLDFGIVKQLDGALHTTKVGQILGTPYFMAPEQADGRRVGPATDVWAMAVVLYSSLSGRFPFLGQHHLAVLMAIAAGDHPPLSAVAPHLPLELAHAIEAALVVDMNARPPDMAAFRDSLLAVASRLADDDATTIPAQPVQPESFDIPSLPAADTRPMQSEPLELRRFPAIASTAAALLVAGLALAGFQHLAEPIAAPVEPQPLAMEEVPPPPPPPPPSAPLPPVTPDLDAGAAREAAYAVKAELDRLLADLRAEKKAEACEQGIAEKEQAVRLGSKWNVADEMFAHGEKQIAHSYYRELEEIARGLVKLCREASPMATAAAPKEAIEPAETGAEQKRAKQHYDRALALRKKGALERAIRELNRAIDIDPEYVSAFHARGLIHQKRGRHAAAMADFDRALEIQDESAPIHHDRAQVRLAMRDTFGALADLDRAIELDRSSVEYVESRARVHTLRDNPRDAAEDLARALQLAPERTDLRLLRARTLAHLQRHSEAVEELSRVIERTPTAEAHFLRGSSRLEEQKLDGAIADFTETLRRQPSHEHALLQRGIARAMLEDREAISDLERFLVLAPRSKLRPTAEKWLAQLKR